MLTMWGIHSQAELYVPGAIRSRRQIEKVSPTPSVAPLKDAQPEEKPVEPPRNWKEKVEEVYQHSRETSEGREPAILAHQIMTSPVVFIDLKASMGEAWKLFHHHRFRHVPVLSNNERLVGILSDRDLWREAAGIYKKPSGESIGLSNLLVQDIMTDQVLTAHPDTEIRSIARVMFEERIGAMPIVNEVGTPVGIITRSDILRTVMNQVPFELWI